MKILHCIAQLPMKTGSGVYFSTLVEGLSKKSHSNGVLYGAQKPFSEISFASTMQSKSILEFPVHFKTADLPFPIAGMSDIMPYESTVYSEMSEEQYEQWISAFEKQLINARDTFNPDVVIVHHLFILASLVQKVFADTKIVGICHGTDLRQVQKNLWIKERYIFNIEKLYACLAVSPDSKADIKNLFCVPEEKIQIVGGGFNPLIFNDTDRHRFDGTFRLVYAGKIADSKGVFELAKTLPVILKKYPNTELVVIGNATDIQKKELYANAENRAELKIRDAQPQIEMSKSLKQSDIFIMPSYYETLGLIAIEALACGMYVVSTEISGLMKLLGDRINKSGIIEYVKLPRIYNVDKAFEEDKPMFVQNLADAIIKQMEKVERNTELYPTVADDIKTHSWDSIIDRIEDILLS